MNIGMEVVRKQSACSTIGCYEQAFSGRTRAESVPKVLSQNTFGMLRFLRDYLRRISVRPHLRHTADAGAAPDCDHLRFNRGNTGTKRASRLLGKLRLNHRRVWILGALASRHASDDRLVPLGVASISGRSHQLFPAIAGCNTNHWQLRRCCDCRTGCGAICCPSNAHTKPLGLDGKIARTAV